MTSPQRRAGGFASDASEWVGTGVDGIETPFVRGTRLETSWPGDREGGACVIGGCDIERGGGVVMETGPALCGGIDDGPVASCGETLCGE